MAADDRVEVVFSPNKEKVYPLESLKVLASNSRMATEAKKRVQELPDSYKVFQMETIEDLANFAQWAKSNKREFKALAFEDKKNKASLVDDISVGELGPDNLPTHWKKSRLRRAVAGGFGVEQLNISNNGSGKESNVNVLFSRGDKKLVGSQLFVVFDETPDLIKVGPGVVDDQPIRIGFGSDVVSEPEITILDDVASKIKIGRTEDETIENLMKFARDNPETIQQVAEIYVSTKLNQDGAKFYVDALRSKSREIFTDPSNIAAEFTTPASDGKDYVNGEWYAMGELLFLADLWHLPVAIFDKNRLHLHWNLVLKPPENGRVLVYDPQENGEKWIQIDSVGHDLKTEPHWGGIYVNRVAEEAFRNGTYNLSFAGDKAYADHADILRAKLARFQFNGSDCGPLCLFSAALRQAMQPGWNEFKFGGKEQLLRDTGLKVHTREEVLGEN